MIYGNNPAWRNGEWCQVKDLNVSILDLGLIHADATYDVMAFRNDKPFHVEEHMDRFLKSCEYWRIHLPYTREELLTAVKLVHVYSKMKDSIIWISATRGIPEDGNPRNLKHCTPDVMIYVKPYQKFNGTNKATVCTAKTALRVPDLCINQNHKNFVWPDLTRAQWEAIDRGFDTAILYSAVGNLTEGPGFNVAIIKNDIVYAPKRNCLPGISMKIVEATCQELGIDFYWADLKPAAIDSCQDMFLTTTIGNIVTVTNLDNRTLHTSEIQQKLINKINRRK